MDGREYNMASDSETENYSFSLPVDEELSQCTLKEPIQYLTNELLCFLYNVMQSEPKDCIMAPAVDFYSAGETEWARNVLVGKIANASPSMLRAIKKAKVS